MKRLLHFPLCQEHKGAWHAKPNERKPLVTIVWQLLYSIIISSSDLTWNGLELIAVHAASVEAFLWRSSHNRPKIIYSLFSPLTFCRCPSPVLHERAGDIQGADGEIHREREPTLERTRSAGEFSLPSFFLGVRIQMHIRSGNTL